jgi:carbamoyltransferase
MCPFMLASARVREDGRERIPGVVHVDGTCRPQIVDPVQQPKFAALLAEIEHHVGVCAVLNTSFNLAGEPLVATPHDALRTFYASGLDALAIEGFLLTKSEWSES